jgi:predicted RNase H-like HicB family nuclease
LDRPFDPKNLSKARRLACQYRIILAPDEELGFIGYSLELPNVFADGPDPEACVTEVREALTGVIAFMLEEGRVPPEPASERRRTAQVNIRLTEEQKLLVEEMARRSGFRGIADYVRSIMLADLERRSA